LKDFLLKISRLNGEGVAHKKLLDQIVRKLESAKIREREEQN
jgi:hypothetical protein